MGSGPSSAAALAAGAAALVLSHRPRLAPAQLSDRLKTTAHPPAPRLPDSQIGHGVLDPQAAISARPPDEPAPSRSAAPRPHTVTKPAPTRSSVGAAPRPWPWPWPPPSA
ncbi:S8 family serine peptidase [Streptomyces griseochromogenes]|uniref:S8 family serine peptidase n=1 Tax=Streptomyces griseochromogenes TaxID=68214 RepID=UPI0037BA4D10